jgi:hypothetical protein
VAGTGLLTDEADTSIGSGYEVRIG